jgi:hypothetical protein
MSNHVHLVVKTGHQRLGTLMQRVFTGYAMRFNGRTGRRGHLLQGRFGSRPLRDEADLLVVIRYVLRNPLEAGLVRSLEDLERYPWGGLSALLGRRPPLPFESVSDTLALFAADEASARSRLRTWMEGSEPAGRPDAPLDALLRQVCAELAVLDHALLCRRAVQAGLGVVDVARALHLSHAAVSQAARRSSSDK